MWEGSIYGRTGGDKFAICIPKEEFKEQDFMDAIQTMGHAFNNDLYHLHIYVGVYEITDGMKMYLLCVIKPILQ